MVYLTSHMPLKWQRLATHGLKASYADHLLTAAFRKHTNTHPSKCSQVYLKPGQQVICMGSKPMLTTVRAAP